MPETQKLTLPAVEFARENDEFHKVFCVDAEGNETVFSSH